MAKLRITDAALLTTVKGNEKIPTGEVGNYAVSIDQVAAYTKEKLNLEDSASVDAKVLNVQTDIDTHKNNLLNPHQVTSDQVGLGNVDNTSDLDKPLSNADIIALSLKADKSYVDSQDQLKADKNTVEASLLLKADKVDLTASKVSSDGGQTQQKINDFGGAKWHNKLGGYDLGAIVRLENGDTVKSTVANNSTNPNIDMTGWVKTNSDSQIQTWSGRTQEQNNKENLSVDDFATIDEAITYAKNVGLKIDGLGKTVIVSVLPTDLSIFKNIAFKVGDITHPTDDFLGISLKQITKTPTYTGWVQDKACQHKGVIYVPIMLAHGHTYDTTRLAWVKSFDGGNTWTSPEILLEQHPTPTTRGWSSLSAGVIGNRFVMIVEERDVATELIINTFIYDRILYLSETMTNSIALTTGSSVATITLENHSLVVGDKVNFSGVSGTDVGGLSGELAVVSVVDANRFTVNKGSNSATTQVDTGGASWTLGATFYANTWRTTNIGTLPDGSGNPVTHVHSFAVKDLNSGEFFVGFHNGTGAREVGALLVSNFWQTPTVVKRRLPALAEASQAEPVVRYDSGKLYITTRGQSRTSNGSIFAWSADNGVTWNWSSFPNNLHYSPLPLVIKDGIAYIFGTERAENEWLATVDNRNNQNRPRSFMLQAPVGELEAGNFANLTTTLLGYGIYQGEQVSTGVGVGSAILYGNSLRYYFMSEDYRNSTRYSLNFPATDNEYLADGYQPDVFEYRIDLIADRAGKNDFILQAADNQHIAVYRNAAGEYEVQQPLRYKNTQAFPRLAVGKTSSIVGDVLAYVNARAEGSAYIPTPYADNTYRTAGDYAAILPNTSSGSDVKYAVLGGGGAVSSARGAMVLAYGADHATTPNEVRINSTVCLSPSNDNIQTLGKASNRWSTLYAGTGTINTSDARLKQQFRSQSENEKAAALEIKNSICLFKFNDAVDLKGDGARWHAGVKAQQVVSIMESQGLNWQEYAFVCFDEWDEQDKIIDESGDVVQEYREAGSRYAIRYDELAMFILSAI